MLDLGIGPPRSWRELLDQAAAEGDDTKAAATLTRALCALLEQDPDGRLASVARCREIGAAYKRSGRHWRDLL